MELNLAVVRGVLSAAPEVRVVASGSTVASLSVRTPTAGRTTSVPVTVWDPPAWVEDLVDGAEVLVLGVVRRRFYRAGPATGSRVDVEATFVGRPTKRDLGAWRRRIEASLAEVQPAS
ncbi:MAG: single-stranded DNA-binding protein [Acidimicrobiia bacterium]